MFRRIFSTIIKTIPFILLWTISPSTVNAEWADLELYGGQIYDIAIDPSNSAKMFAGGYYGGGLFKTEDSAVNWEPVLTGAEGTGLDGEATFSNTAVWDIEFAPSNTDIVWAVHNYWAERSMDGGETWDHIWNSRMQGSQFRWCESVAIDPSNPNYVYVGTAGPGTNSEPWGTIYKTTNGQTSVDPENPSGSGPTWTNVGPNDYYSSDYGQWFYNQFPYPVTEIEIDPQNGAIIYAISSNGSSSYVFRSSNWGNNWSQIGLFSENLSDIEVKPDDSNSVYVSGYNGVRRFYNSGGWTWVWVYNSSGSDFRALTFQPGNSNILYAAGRHTYWGYYNISAVAWYWRNIGYKLISLAAKPATTSTPHCVFGGELHRGVIRDIYTQLNPSLYVWATSERKNGINAIQVHDVAVNQNDTDHYLVATEDGLYEKASSAGSWVRKGNFPLTSTYTVAFDPGNSNTYYVGTEGRVYRSTDGGATWPDYVSVSGVACDISPTPSGYSNLFVTTRNLGSGTGYVYRMGKDLSGLTNIKPSGVYDYNTVAVNPNSPSNILVGGGNYFGTKVLGHIYESTNSGSSWTTRLSNVIVNSILIDPNNTNNMYAGCGWAGGTEIPLYKSTDGGTTWQRSYKGIPGGPNRFGIWGSSSTDIFVLRHTGSTPKGGEDDDVVLHYDGSWERLYTTYSDPLYSIWGSASNNVWAVGQAGRVLRYNGSSWANWHTGTSPDFDFHDIWGSASNNIFAVGTGPRIYRFNGSSWSSYLTSAQENLHGVWGNSTSNFYAVGSFGTIMRWNGSGWYALTSPVTECLEDIWGSSSTNIFAVGDARSVGSTRYYTILRSTNGSSWSIMSTPSVPSGKSGKLRAVWGSSSSNVFAVGDDGVILRYNGSIWSEMNSGETAPLYGVWGTSSSNIYAVGLFGAIIRYNGSSWSDVDTSINQPGDEKVTTWNPVTHLGLSPEGHLYASTNRQGIFASTNDGLSWINMNAPPYTVYAVDAGSVISGGSAGTHSLDGEGLLNGYITDTDTGMGLEGALIETSLTNGPDTATETDGSWAMLHPGGTYHVTASRPEYAPKTEPNVPVYDGTWTNVTMDLSAPIVTVKMNGEEVLAVNEEFVGSYGRVYPNPAQPGDCGDYGWTNGSDGQLMVPYRIGCVNLLFEANQGFHIQDVLINGVSMGAISQYTFENVDENQSLEVIFTIDNYTVNFQTATIPSGTGGYVSGASTQSVPQGGNCTPVTAVAYSGYMFTGWTGDYSSSSPSITVTNVTSNMTVTANFIRVYTVSFLAGTGGYISGAVTQSIPYGDNCSAVTAVANTGYTFSGWDGGFGMTNPLTVSNVTSDMTITATFTPNQYTVTFMAATGGTITGEPAQTVNHGGDCSMVTAVANTGYTFSTWSGSYSGPANPLTVTNVTSNMTITANFTINQYTVTFVAGTGGTITGELMQTVNHGGDCSAVTAVADMDYIFSGWDGGYGFTNPLTVSNVTSNLTIIASFKRPAQALPFIPILLLD